MKATQAAIARPSATESEKERQRDVIGGKRKEICSESAQKVLETLEATLKNL